MKSIGIFGATGFIGRHSCQAAVSSGLRVHAICRTSRQMASFDNGIQCYHYDKVVQTDNAGLLLPNLDCVVHLADNPGRSGAEVDAALNTTKLIARAVVASGIRKFIYISSIYASDLLDIKTGTYGAGKKQAEDWLLKQSDLDPIILRIAPVYGPNSKGGVKFLSTLVEKGLPIPLKAAKEPRDYLYIDNLTSLFVKLANMSDDSWQVLKGHKFNVSDGFSVSTARLVKEISGKLGVRPKLFWVPKPLLMQMGKMIGKSDQIESAFERLAVGNSKQLIEFTSWYPHDKIPESLEYLKKIERTKRCTP